MSRTDLMYDCISTCRRVGSTAEFFFLVTCGLIHVNNSFLLSVPEAGSRKLKKETATTTANNKITPWLRCHDGHRSMAISIISLFYRSLRLRPQNITRDEVICQLKTRHIIICYYTSDSQAE